MGRGRYLPPHVLQPGAAHYILVTTGVDGTSRWFRGYVHCALGVPGWGPTNLGSWRLFEGAEKWKMAFALHNECDFDGQLQVAATAKLRKMMEGCVPLCFPYEQMARHMCGWR